MMLLVTEVGQPSIPPAPASALFPEKVLFVTIAELLHQHKVLKQRKTFAMPPPRP